MSEAETSPGVPFDFAQGTYHVHVTTTNAADEVAVFKTGYGEFLAMQTNVPTGLQPVNLQFERFNNRNCPVPQIDTIAMVTPEPGTLLLFSAGLAVLLAIFRHSKKLRQVE